jgi:uncharacterized protein (PEP-CTERM system associated)
MRLRPAERSAARSPCLAASRGAAPVLTGLVLALTAALGWTPLACAQSGAGFRLTPTVSVTETLSTNVDLSATKPRSDAITQVTLGVSIGSRSGPLRGFLNYGLTGNFYARDSGRNSISNQNALKANFDTEVVEGRAFVGVSASIGQTATSAFGAQPGLSGLPSTNVTEFRTLSITPRFIGPLGPAVRYTAGLGYTVSNASGTAKGDSSSSSAFVRLGPSSPGVIGWGIDFTATQSGFAGGRSAVDKRLTGTLSRKIDALDLLVNVSAGAEATDLASFEQAQHQTYGIGLTWVPSPRTKLVAQLDERFFGRAHAFRFEHRTALTTWTLSDSRSLNLSGNGISTGGRGATFDLYYAQFAAIEPDPVKRTDLVNSYLKANGLAATSGADSGFLRSGETVVRGQNLSVAYRGLRGAAVLAVARSVNVPIKGGALPGGDFINTASIVSDNVSLNLSHRLTPTSSANLTLSHQQSQGDQPAQYGKQRELRLQYVAGLTDRSNVTAGTRRALYQTYQTHFNESAVFATYGYRF